MRLTGTLGAFFQQVAEAKLARAIDTDDALLMRARVRAKAQDRQTTTTAEERTLKLAA